MIDKKKNNRSRRYFRKPPGTNNLFGMGANYRFPVAAENVHIPETIETFDLRIFFYNCDLRILLYFCDICYLHGIIRKELPWLWLSNVLNCFQSTKCVRYWQAIFGFFHNKRILVELDKLDQFDKVVHVWIRIHLQSHKAQKAL